MDTLNLWDTQLFLMLNGWHTPFWDPVMAWVSEKTSWIPLYLAVTLWLMRLYRWRAAWILLALGLLVVVGDQMVSHLFKDLIQRPRPCHQPELTGLVHLVEGHCGGLYGFVSNHACNHFAVAVFTALWLRHRWYWVVILTWASMVAYSRIYLGVHYPADVMCGALLGSLLALGMYRLLCGLGLQPQGLAPPQAREPSTAVL